MEKIQLYINGDVILSNGTEQKVNRNFIKALEYMYSRWPHLIDIYIYPENSFLKENITEFPYLQINKDILPENINKMYHLIDNNYDHLCHWEIKSGKSIAFDVQHTSKEKWEGFSMNCNMSQEDYIKVFRKTMHLYD